MNELKVIEMRKNLLKMCLFFLFYWFIVFIAHHILISIATFFHFQIGHGLGEIENWIFENSWEFIILSKLMAFWVIIKFISIQSNSRNHLREVLTQGFLQPSRQLYVFIIFFIMSVVILGRPVVNDLISPFILKPIVSFIGVLVFYMTDVIVSSSLKRIYSPSFKNFLMISFLFSITTFLFSKYIFSYGLEVDYRLFSLTFLILFLSNEKKDNWSLPILLLFFCLSPMTSLIGWDPFWKNSFSPLVFSRQVSNLNLSIIVLVGVLYLVLNRLNELKLSTD